MGERGWQVVSESLNFCLDIKSAEQSQTADSPCKASVTGQSASLVMTTSCSSRSRCEYKIELTSGEIVNP